MKLFVRTVLLYFVCLCESVAQAQDVSNVDTYKVSGVIVDSKTKEPIFGATISVKGSTKGVLSDLDGKFEFEVSSSKDILIISYIGYKNISKKAEEITGVIELEDDNKYLEEVMVTAVAIKKEKRELGYSAQDVKSAEITQSQETNIVNALSSKVAGVQVISSSGSPGAAARIRIRGNSSLTQNNDPLIVLDGLPIDNSGGESTRTLESSNRAIDINPNDIESMTILKGPVATALYGIRAANGAIIITTKRGKSGAARVNFSSNVGMDVVNKLPEIQTKYAGGNDGVFVPFDNRVDRVNPSTGNSRSWGPSYDQLRYNGIPSKWDSRGDIIQSTDPNLQALTPYDNLNTFFQPGIRYENYLSATGGTEKSTYFMSAGNYRQNGVIPNTFFERSSVKLTGANQINKIIKLSASGTYTYSTADRVRKGGNWGSPWVSLLRSPNDFDMSGGVSKPVQTPSSYQFADGTQRQNAIFDNPYFAVNNNISTEKINRVIGFVQTDITPLSWLSMMGRVGTDFNNFDDRQNYSKFSAENHAEQSFVGSLRNVQSSTRNLNTDFIVSADKKINKDFSVGARVGHNYWHSQSTHLDATGYGYIFPNFNTLSNTQSIETFESQRNRKLMGVYSEAKISFRNYAFLTGTIRREFSSTLPKDNTGITYPSVNAALVFTDMLNMDNHNILSFGKIRVAWAQVGNFPSPYLTDTYYSQVLGVPYQGQNLFAIQNFQGNPKFRPEVANSFEVGTELRFFKNRLFLDVTYYDTKNNDQIVRISSPPSSGFSAAWVNSGYISNKGWEIVLSGSPIKTNDFTWEASVNFFRYRNIVNNVATEFQQIGGSAGFTQGYSSYSNGQPYGIIVGASRFKRYGQDPNDKTIRNDLPIIVDSAGYPIIEAGNFIIGNPNPNYTVAVRNGFTYKNFTFNTLLDIRRGGDMFNLTRLNMLAMGTHKDTENRDNYAPLPNSVNADGSVNTTPIYLDRTYYSKLGGDFGNVPERGIEDASWVRMRELSIGYNFGTVMKKYTRTENLTLGFTTRNLFLITKYTGIDPETNAAGNDPSFGRDAYNLPNTRSFVFTLNATF